MSRILFINSVCNGSTGTICKNLYKAAEEAGHECCIAFGRGDEPKGFRTIRVGNKFDIYSHVLKARLFDASGLGSKQATKEFIKKIDNFKPDIIHLHNMHGYYINIEVLFNYLKKHPEIKKVWTLHDCWSFTGHCPYYTYKKCSKWQKGCKGRCPNRKEYPKTMFSRVKSNFIRKKDLFTSIENMILVSPSEWLKKEAELSFLKEYCIKVVNNDIDTSVFKPTKSAIKEQYGIKDKQIVLGVASVWDKRKGIDIFIELAKQLNNKYQIVMIGLNKKQIKKLPDNIIGLVRTEDVQELVKWYSVADIYLNPTLEDNYPTTNLEAIACGTSVITFNTGGSPESSFAFEDEIIFSQTIEETLKKIYAMSDKRRFKKELIQSNTSSYLQLYNRR